MTNNVYQKIASHEIKQGETIDKVVLLYSGGLDTSCMLKWIQEEYQAGVIALTIDLGQQADDLEAAKQKALRLGAIDAFVVDCKEEFAQNYLVKAIKANADYQGGYHLSTPIGRPLLAKVAVQVAHQTGATVIAHGATGKGNDQVRIESAILCEDPSMKIIAPVREWAMGRDEELTYAALHHIDTKQNSLQLPYSWDDNMWGVTGEGGEIEDPKLIPDYKKILQVVTPPELASNEPEFITLTFKSGVPTQLNDKHMSLSILIQELNRIAGKHGVGITTLIEDRLVGLKVRGVYESPAAEVLIKAHYNLEKLVSTQTSNEFKQTIDDKWAYLCYNAKWHDPLMQHLNSFIDSMNENVTGAVTVKLFKGTASVVAVSSPFSLFDQDLATFNKNGKFNQNASAGFIEIYSLAMKTAALK